MKRSNFRVRLEIAIAVVAGALGVLTVFWQDWIEALTGWDPDQHDGAFEWVIVAVLLAVAAAVGVLARRDWRRLAAASPSAG
jgi:hypothetical protein